METQGNRLRLHIGQALSAGALCLLLLAEAAQVGYEEGGVAGRDIATEPASWLLVRDAWPLLLPALGLSLLLAIGYVRMRRLAAQRMKVEAKLSHELALKEALLASLPGPVAAKGPDLRYMDLNPAFERFFGIRKADAVGRHALEVEHLRDRMSGELLALQDEAMRTMAPRHKHLQMKNAAGELRRVKFWVSPFRNPDGTPGGIVTMHFDVTEIDEARERAQEFERRLKDVIDSLPVTVFQSRLRTRDLDQNWEVTYAAGDGAGLGVDTASALGAGSPEQAGVCPEDHPRLRAAILESARSCQPLDIVGRLKREAELRWIQARATPRREGVFTVWNGVILDVTDQHRQADALQEAKEAAESALRAKEGFLAMMSHEIRTPMNGILGLVELLQNTGLAPEQQRLLALAQESGQALAQILDDILDYAKIEAGRLAILPAPLDLRDLLDSVSSLLMPQAQKKGLQLRLYVSPEVPATVRADGIRMRQILFNLLGNAIKFTDHGSVALRATIEACTDETATVLVEVQDTGIGIAKADMGRLFTPFVQVERSSTRRFGGTGLGLAISRSLAAMMGGSLALSSEEGTGTTAALRVPCTILCQQYELPLLQQRKVAVRVRDPDIAQALLAHVRTAGMVPLAEHDEAAQAAVVLADADPLPALSGDKRLVLVTTKWKQLGFGADQHGSVRLSANPLRWAAFIGAVERALERQASPAVAGEAGPTQAAAALRAPRRWRILVAEDHRINQDVIRQQLVRLGHLPTVVDNGEAALQALGSGEFDLVLTDFHLPVMDGFALTQAIRNSRDAALHTLPVVGITATTAPDEHRLGFDSGMNACVLKPVTLASLQEGLSRAMDARGSAREPIGAGPRRAGGTGIPAFDATRLRRESLLEVLHAGSGDAGLQDCIAALAEDRERLVDCLARGAIGELKPWCHRMRGALSVFGHPHLDEIMDRFQKTVQSGAAAQVRAAGQPVLDVIAYLIEALGTDAGAANDGAAGRVQGPVSCRDCARPDDACPGGNSGGDLVSGVEE
ncbi:ATP-binding protein [Cupriavidus sp. WKF15]|uniref:ATP-binding protein n=1 Tax=Cupriavidus sp. WKF15 TaxID=3032282 RepID=UPI0023E14FFA|nr:ATP-binding protein [Cupriavidus sp. WKF15]WER49884.1 ATP-binding protein [Cupriavidus sp. WKF15]